MISKGSPMRLPTLKPLLILLTLSGCSASAPSGDLAAACLGTMQPRDRLMAALLDDPGPQSHEVAGAGLLAKLDAACAAIGAE